MFNAIGGLLDNPLRGAGLQPEQMDPQIRSQMRLQALSALGGQLAGGPNFFDSMQKLRLTYDQEQQQRLQQEAKAAQQRQLQALFSQGGPAPEAPGQAPAAPGQSPAAPGFGQAPAGQPNPNKAKADQYRRAASLVAATSPETAAKYVEIADKIDPRDDFYAPTEAGGQFFQASKTGQVRGIEGFQPKPPAAPSAVQEYQFAVGQGYKGSFDQWDTARRRAGATNVSVTNAEKPFINALAGDLGAQVAASRDQAIAAQGNLATIEQIQSALPSAITGPGADARLYLARLQSVLGVGGASDQERLANTARVVQGLALAELDAAQLMKGQGQITEAERAIIRRAAGGEITMTPAEITALLAAVKKVSENKIRTHQSNVQGLRGIPGVEPLMPFFAGQGGAPAAPAAAAPGNIQEAARQELLRRQGAR
jgi:hypothetical protein